MDLNHRARQVHYEPEGSHHSDPREELSRRTVSGEPAIIDLEKIVIVTKKSKFELDLETSKLSEKDLLCSYEKEGVDADRVLHSHMRQRDSLQALRRIFDEKQFFTPETLSVSLRHRPQLFLALGGDNHIQRVSRLVKEDFFLGVNSDPLSSEGALSTCTVTELPEILLKLSKGEFRIQEWSRLTGTVSKVALPLTLGDVYIGERERLFMSRHVLRYRNDTEEQKGSGLLIATGSGSTGWFKSASAFSGQQSFSRTSKAARFLLTEPFKGRLNGVRLIQGDILPGEVIEITSLNDAGGVVACDSYHVVPFTRGQKALILLSEYPLKVIHPFT